MVKQSTTKQRTKESNSQGDQSEEPKAILMADVSMMETQSKQPIKKFGEAYLQLKFLAKL